MKCKNEGKNNKCIDSSELSGTISAIVEPYPALLVRSLSVSELELCFPLGYGYAKEFKHSTFISEIFRRNWEVYLSEGNSIMLGLFEAQCIVGMLGGMTYPEFDSGIPIAEEIVFYIRRDSRTKPASLILLRSFEQWAYGQGAKAVIVRSPGDRKMSLYQERGYLEAEVSYRKCI